MADLMSDLVRRVSLPSLAIMYAASSFLEYLNEYVVSMEKTTELLKDMIDGVRA